MLRRRDARPTPTSSIPTIGPVRMDLDGHVVTVNGTETSLTAPEFRLLELLLHNAGPVLTRAQLIEQVWGVRQVAGARILDVRIKRLRSKVEPDPSAPRHLQTVPGVGYKFLS